MRLQFLGGAGEVTGSCYLVETQGCRFLLECGMFQGGRDADRRNREAFEIDPRTLDFVLLSHAHIDHSGLIPRLVAQGFRGPIYATQATVDLAGVMLPDSAYIQEREAQQQSLDRRRSSGRGRPRAEVAPLYTVLQAQESLRRMRGVAYGVPFSPHPGLECLFRDAGHILGSATVEVQAGGPHGRRLVFSGDLGQPGHPLVRDAELVRSADVLLVESTYGNRCHKGLDETLDELVAAVTDTLARKRGNIIIPAFAVGRTQDILFLLADLHRRGRLPALDVYVDSPMALAATEITVRHADLLDREGRAMLHWFRHDSGGFRVRFVQDVEDSIALNSIRAGAVIVSASGMCDAGRIKHHLAHNIGRPECSVIFTGFQAAGTLGRRIVDGVARVRIFGADIEVRADVYTIGGLSAHADREALLGWLRRFERPPERTFVVHGEPLATESLREAIGEQLGWVAEAPVRGQVVAL